VRLNAAVIPQRMNTDLRPPYSAGWDQEVHRHGAGHAGVHSTASTGNARRPSAIFAEELPVFGILFDALAAAIGTAGEPGYRGFFSLGLLAGLYLEVFFGVAVVCPVAGIVMRSLGGHEVEGRR